MGALISAARTDIYTMPSPSTLISTTDLPWEVRLHTFWEPHYIKQFKLSALICDKLMSSKLYA